MALKAQLDNERKEMGIFTEEEEDATEERSKFRSPNWKNKNCTFYLRILSFNS